MAATEPTVNGDYGALAADLAESVALLATAVLRLTPDIPEREDLARVLRKLGDHVEALGREDVLLPIELAWIQAARSLRS